MPKPYKRRIMRKFTISEISGVGNPAQQGARVSILKSADARKNTLVQAMTGKAEGHQHGIRISVYDGKPEIWMEWASGEGQEPHSHSIYRTPEGQYEILENSGHTHTIDNEAISAAILSSVQKTHEGDSSMSDETAAFQSKIERLETIIAMKPDHRKHFDGLPDDKARDDFLAKSVAERDAILEDIRKTAEIEKAKQEADDPVLYTTQAGIDIRKSEGPTVLALAKAHDESQARIASMAEENQALRKAQEAADYAKRAETELAHLPGSVESRAELLKAAESIENDDARKQAVDALRAQSRALTPAFQNFGTGAVGTGVVKSGDTGPQAKLDAMAAEIRKNDPSLTEEMAIMKATESPEGMAIYSEILAAESAATRH